MGGFERRRSRIGWFGRNAHDDYEDIDTKEDLLRTQLLYQTSELYYSHAPAMERSSASF
jgi:hypothetical protein